MGVDGACMKRHSSGINVCFMDSAASKVDAKELWTLKWHKNYKRIAPEDLDLSWLEEKY
jgi:prepilin-type processing-associated H-X9-DG protein